MNTNLVSHARRALAGSILCALGTATMAQSNWREQAVPMYGLDVYAHGEALALATRAERFLAASSALTTTLTSYCLESQHATALAETQAKWAQAAEAWDALVALSTGPLIERRSARSIDFMPPRPKLIEKAMLSAPQGEVDMERIGAPARGFPALELLLWQKPSLKPATPECTYARMVGADIEREAQALKVAADQRAETHVENEDALAWLVETVNQWVGGVEQLRWTFMRKPLDVAATRSASPQFPRQTSGQTAAAWAARWQTLRDAAVLGARPVPAVGAALVPFETLLRGRGLNPLADRLVEATARADRAMQGLQPGSQQGVAAAAQTLAELTKLVQESLAPALDVRMGFSDADGD